MERNESKLHNLWLSYLAMCDKKGFTPSPEKEWKQSNRSFVKMPEKAKKTRAKKSEEDLIEDLIKEVKENEMSDKCMHSYSVGEVEEAHENKLSQEDKMDSLISGSLATIPDNKLIDVISKLNKSKFVGDEIDFVSMSHTTMRMAIKSRAMERDNVFGVKAITNLIELALSNKVPIVEKSSPNEPEDKMLTIIQAMARLEIGKQTVYSYLKTGRIKGDWALNKISENSVEDYIKNKKAIGGSKKTTAISKVPIKSATDIEKFYTIEETMEILGGIQRGTVILYLKQGVLRGDRVANKVNKDDVDLRLAKKQFTQIKQGNNNKVEPAVEDLELKEDVKSNPIGDTIIEYRDVLPDGMAKAFFSLSKNQQKYYFHRIMADSYKG